MMTDKDKLDIALSEIRSLKKEIKDLKDWKAKCDRAALKYGSFIMGMLTLAALIVVGLDKAGKTISEILLGWFLPK